MTDQAITDLSLASVVLPTDTGETVRDPSGSPNSEQVAFLQRCISNVLFSTTSTGGIAVGPGSTSVSLAGTGVGSLVIPANTIQAGNLIRIQYCLSFTSAGGGSLDPLYRLTFNGSDAGSTNSHTITSGSSGLIIGRLYAQFKTIGASGAFRSWNRAIRSGIIDVSKNTVFSGTVDTTSAITLDLKAVSTAGTTTVTYTPDVVQFWIQQPGQ